MRPIEKRDEGIRYRWLGDTNGGIRNGGEERETAATRYTGIQAALYVRGEAVGLNRTASTGTRGGSVYLGKDILGSVRSASNEYGVLEDRYEYDAFGKPYKGEFGDGMNLGYTGKPYDTTTGLYNYGYRDYKPEAARFTTVDPIRDGSNWFAYVNNDPVNWIDLWGLEANEPESTYFLQTDWREAISGTFADNACAATSLLNELSEQYTVQTGTIMRWDQGLTAMLGAVNLGHIDSSDATVNSWGGAANAMWGSLGQEGTWMENAEGNHQIYARDSDGNGIPDHFLNSAGNGEYRDPWNGNIGNVEDLPLQTDRPVRGLDFYNGDR